MAVPSDREKKILTNRRAVFIIMLLLCALWGSAYPAVKIGYDMLSVSRDHVPSIMLFAGVRYILTGVMLLTLMAARYPEAFRLDKTKVRCVLLNTVFQVIGQYYFYYIGLVRTPGSRAAIINSTTVFFSVFLASFVFRTEKYSLLKLIASVMAIASLFVLNYVPGAAFSFSLSSEGFILASSFFSAIAVCLQKPLARRTGVLPLCSYSFLLGGVVFMAYAIAFHGHLEISGSGSALLLVYVAAVSAIGFSVQALLLKYNDVSVISVYRIMLPVSGVILSALLLDEWDMLFRWNTAFSLSLMAAAMLTLSFARRQRGGK